eukprot:TRINITY_DN8897_c0_g1_i1.p1 TRINITY_DN8897_c0_g1~~TRINITY_DN8897_c0_g1_i1.p1  ORF type:complete len:471 (+),score=30.83 TRINITY_DN8897_c0_g1_i1:2-1414(+)
MGTLLFITSQVLGSVSDGSYQLLSKRHQSFGNQSPSKIVLEVCRVSRVMNCILPQQQLALSYKHYNLKPQPNITLVMATTTAPHIQYCSFDKSASGSQIDNLIVTDCTHPAAITLTHHKGSNNLENVEPADSSTSLVINAIKSDNQFMKNQVKFVTCNHFDIDAVLSIWAVINQKEAAKWEPVLKHAARIGDFREVALSTTTDYQLVPEFKQDGISSSEQVQLALKLCCWLNTLEKGLFSAPYEGVGDDDEKFAYFLPKIQEFLCSPEKQSQDGLTEYDQVVNDYRELESLPNAIETGDDISLAIVRTPRQMHYYSIFSFTVGYDYVLTIYPGRKYELESKYTQYINLYSRPTLPRLNLVPLAAKLNLMEKQNEIGQSQQNILWDVSRFVDPGPLLRLDDSGKMLSKKERYGHPFDRHVYTSSIQEEDFVNMVVSYLRFGYQGLQAKVGGWSWRKLQQINKQIIWDNWEV